MTFKRSQQKRFRLYHGPFLVCLEHTNNTETLELEIAVILTMILVSGNEWSAVGWPYRIRRSVVHPCRASSLNTVASLPSIQVVAAIMPLLMHLTIVKWINWVLMWADRNKKKGWCGTDNKDCVASQGLFDFRSDTKSTLACRTRREETCGRVPLTENLLGRQRPQMEVVLLGISPGESLPKRAR